MDFAKFQSTYKSPPIDVYERTGQELEAKYFKNRETTSLLRQSMSNVKVEDRNLGIVANATSDVEGMLNKVNGNWQYATGVLMDAKDRLVNDKALNASIEDYGKRAAAQTDLQNRFEANRIDQDGVDASNFNDRFYNTKSITVAPDGTLKNRWVNPSAPNKPDIDAQTTKLMDILLKNPDSVDSGLKNILDKNGVDTGYLERTKTTGVGSEKIFGLVKGWLANSPGVKQYYQYINRADLLSKTTSVDANGNVTNKSILPILVSQYRDLGWNIDPTGKLLDNYQHYINPRGEFDVLKDKDGKSVELKDAPPSLLESADVKILMSEDKLPLESALQQSFLSHKLNGQLNSIAETYSKLGFESTTSTGAIKNEAHWMKVQMDMDRISNAGLHNTFFDKAALFNTSYSIKDAGALGDKMKAELATIDSNSPRGMELTQRLKEQTENIQSVSKVFATSPDGIALVNKLWNDVTQNLTLEEKDMAYKSYRNSFEDYLTGNGTLPTMGTGLDTYVTKKDKPITITAISNPFMVGYDSKRILNTTDIEGKKRTFQTEVDKKIKDGLSVDNNYRVFSGTNNKGEPIQAPFHKMQGDYIKKHGDSWVLPGNLKDGEPTKLQEFIPQMIKTAKLEGHGYNPDEWDAEYFPNANSSTGFGTGVIKFTTNKNFPNSLVSPIVPPIIVRPDASVKNPDLFSNMKYLYENTDSPEIKQYAEQGMAMSVYGDKFAPLLNNIAVGVQLGGDENLKSSRTIVNVPFGNKSYTMHLVPEGKGDYNLYLDPQSVIANGGTPPVDEHNNPQPVATGKSIPDMITSLYSQHTKIRQSGIELNTTTYKKEGLASFLDAVGNKESSNNPTNTTNPNYVGKYQFGQVALNTVGRNDVTVDKFKKDPSIWPEAEQDNDMIKLMNTNEKTLSDIIAKYNNTKFKDTTITKSGILAAAHIGGATGVRHYFESDGKFNPKDSQGTSIEDYLLKFSGYTI